MNEPDSDKKKHGVFGPTGKPRKPTPFKYNWEAIRQSYIQGPMDSCSKHLLAYGIPYSGHARIMMQGVKEARAQYWGQRILQARKGGACILKTQCDEVLTHCSQYITALRANIMPRLIGRTTAKCDACGNIVQVPVPLDTRCTPSDFVNVAKLMLMVAGLPETQGDGDGEPLDDKTPEQALMQIREDFIETGKKYGYKIKITISKLPETDENGAILLSNSST